MFPRFLDQPSMSMEIEFAFRVFDQIPADWDQDCVEIERDEFRPGGP